MTNEKNLKLVLENKIEEVLFDTQKLNRLKESIKKVGTGEISVKVLKEIILESRAVILEKLTDELLGIFKFHANQLTIKKQLSEFTSEGSTEIRKELQEKNALLEKVSTSVSSIYEKVKKRLKSPV